jgi:capsular polysaccharide biosynthesis protein
MRQQSQGFEQEIDLREYIEVIIRRKALILAVFFISIMYAAVMSYVAPKIYEVSMLIEPPVVGVNDSGGPVFADLPLSIKARIDAGAFDSGVIKALELNSGVTVATSQPKDSTFLKVSINEPESKKELGVKILNQFSAEINNYYKSVIELKKNDIERCISVISNKIKNADNSIKLNEENLKIVEAWEKELMDEVKDAKSNTEQLLYKSSALFEKKVPGDDISSLLYTNTVQQNIAYFNHLNNQLFEIKIEKESLANTVKTLQNEINDFSMEAEKLKAAKESIHNISLIKEPRVSSSPIGPGRRKNVVVAGMLSLILGAFLAFFIEFLQKSKPIVIARSPAEDRTTKQSQ